MPPKGPRCCVPPKPQLLSAPQRPQILSVPQRSQVLNVLQRHIMGTKGLGSQLTVLLGPAPAVKKATLLRHGHHRGRGTLVPSYSSFLLQEMNCLTVPRASVIICHLTIVPREIQPGNQSLKSPKPGEKYSSLLEKVIISSICQRDKTGTLFCMKICRFEL